MHSSQGVKCRFVFPYVKRFKQAEVCWVIFQCNDFDFNAFVILVLAYSDMFVYGLIYASEMFFHTIMDEASGAPDVVLVTVFACNLHPDSDTSSLVQ